MSNIDFYKMIIKDSIIAGVLIGLGCIVNLSVDSKLLGATLFSLGLITVILQQRWLYTGKIGYYGFCWQDTFALITCLIFNLGAIGLMCWTFSHYGEMGIDSSHICEAKLNESWSSALVKSTGCGMLMYIAVEGYKRSKELLAVVLPIIVFILCGYDHCVANYGYLAMNDIFYCDQLPIWIAGNTLGSWIISKI